MTTTTTTLMTTLPSNRAAIYTKPHFVRPDPRPQMIATHRNRAGELKPLLQKTTVHPHIHHLRRVGAATEPPRALRKFGVVATAAEEPRSRCPLHDRAEIRYDQVHEATYAARRPAT